MEVVRDEAASLTSNQPKPCSHGNIPMMEHVSTCSASTGSRTSWSPWPSWPMPSGPISGRLRVRVRMVYATESTPLGTAGSVRNARDELSESFLVISGDVLTDFDLSQVVAFHQERGGMATLASRRWTTPGVRHRHHQRGRIHRALLEKPTWARSSATPSTPDLRPGTRDLRLHPEGQPVDFSGESFPRRWLPASRCSGTWPTATGRTSGPSRPISSPIRTSSTNWSRWTSAASSPPEGVARQRAEIDPSVVIDGRRSSVTTV